MTEKKIFLYKLSLSLNISRLDFETNISKNLGFPREFDNLTVSV